MTATQSIFFPMNTPGWLNQDLKLRRPETFASSSSEWGQKDWALWGGVVFGSVWKEEGIYNNFDNSSSTNSKPLSCHLTLRTGFPATLFPLFKNVPVPQQNRLIRTFFFYTLISKPNRNNHSFFFDTPNSHPSTNIAPPCSSSRAKMHSQINNPSSWITLRRFVSDVRRRGEGDIFGFLFLSFAESKEQPSLTFIKKGSKKYWLADLEKGHKMIKLLWPR